MSGNLFNDPVFGATARVIEEASWPADDPGPPEPEPDEPSRRLNGHRISVVERSDTPAHLRYPVLDWHRLFDGAPDDVEWLVPDLIARGQSYSLVSPAKAGKSLLMLDVAAAIATGRSALGNPPQAPTRVLYADLENSRDDIAERLREMGYRAADLGNLLYLSFPTLPPLDSMAGGADIIDVAAHHDVALVVLDTLARVVAGEENSADTYRNLYRHTLAPLKAARRAVVRLDNRGKSPNAGARGSSAKNDDVDVVWQLTQTPGPEGEAYVSLKCERQRGSAHPDQIHLVRDSTPQLRHVARPATLSPPEQKRVGECIEAMKRLGLPPDTGRPRALKVLRESGFKVRNDTVMAAVKARKLATNCPEVDGGMEKELFS
jgi:AAA domain